MQTTFKLLYKSILVLFIVPLLADNNSVVLSLGPSIGKEGVVLSLGSSIDKEGLVPGGSNREFTIVESYSAPGSNPFGLAWEDQMQYLWYTDRNLGDYIFTLDPNAPSNTYSSIPSPEIDPSGLAWDGQYLWNSDWSNGMIYKINPSNGNVISSFPTPSSGFSGLTWDGQYLWCTGNSGSIYKLDPNSGNVISQISYAGSYTKGLTWQTGYLWVAIDGNSINKYDPISGALIESHSAPGTGATGLTWDGEYLWNLDNGSDTIYKIDIGAGCDGGYVDDCSGDGDCCPESWIGDGFDDCAEQSST